MTDSEAAFQRAVAKGMFKGLSYPKDVVQVDLPWPSPVLSPNSRTHWARKADAVKLARANAGWLTMAAMQRKPKWQRVAVSVVFCPPDRRRRDRDNLIASMKAATDGIADALGIDDSNFIPTYAMGEIVKGGVVRVALAEADLPIKDQPPNAA